MKSNIKVAKQVEELEADIKSYDRVLRRHPNDDNAHHSKAAALTKLGDITGDKSYYDKALKCYNKALELFPQNSMYLADRSKLHIAMDRPDLAAEDITASQQSPDMGNKVLNMYTTHTVKDVLKLDSVQSEVNKLISAGKLPAELEGVFSNMIQVISGISSRVSEHDTMLGEHGERLDIQAEELKEVKKQLAEYQGQYPELLSVVKAMSEQITTLQSQIKEQGESIHEITEQMTKLCTSEEFNKYAAESKTMFSMFGDKVKLVEAKVEGQEKMLVHIDDTLDKANIFNEVEIKDGFNRLKSSYGPNTHEYAYKFYWIMSNYVLAHRMLSTGMIEGQAHKNQSSLFEKISTSIASTLGTALEAVPYAGNVIGVITGFIVDINNAYQGAKSDLIVKRVVDSLCGSMLDKDLNLAIANAAIKIAELKHEAINDPRAGKAEGKLGRAEEWISSKIDKLISKISKVKETYESVPSKLALEDVVLLVSLIVSSDEKLTQEGSNPKILGDRIADMLDKGADDELQKIYDSNNKSGKETKKETKSDKTTKKIFAVTDIEYDNKLLDQENIELLERASEALSSKGMKLSKAIDLSTGLSHGLVKEAIDNGDIDTLVAGLMSLSEGAEF